MQDWHLIPIDELTEDQRQVYAKYPLDPDTEITDEKVVIVSAMEWNLLLAGMATIRRKLEEFLGV